MRYKLYVNKNAKKNIMVLPVEIESLSQPLQIGREPDQTNIENKDDQQNVVAPLGGIEYRNHRLVKKRTEIVEHEEIAYLNLVNDEKNIWLIEDSDQRSFTGILESLSAPGTAATDYLVLVKKNAEEKIDVFPLHKWYRFGFKPNPSVISQEEAERKLNTVISEYPTMREEAERKKLEEKEDIDYIEMFDDDDENYDQIEDSVEEQNTKLTTFGKKIEKIIKETENSEDESGEFAKKSLLLTDEDIEAAFKEGPCTVREIVEHLKGKLNRDAENKNILKSFIQRRCIIDKKTRKIVLKEDKQ